VIDMDAKACIGKGGVWNKRTEECRKYLTDGDIIEATDITLTLKDKDFVVHDMSDATLTVWDDEKEEHIPTKWDDKGLFYLIEG